MFLKMTYRFSEIFIKIPTGYFFFLAEIDSLILKFIIQNSQNHLEKKNENSHFPISKLTKINSNEDNVLVTKGWHRGQHNRIRDHTTAFTFTAGWFPTRMSRHFNERENSLCDEWFWDKWLSRCKRTMMQKPHITCKNSKRITNLHAKA